jgi:hypothetical protein
MADPLREGGRASPEDSARHGSSRPEAASAEAFGAEQAGPQLERRFERALSLSRIVVVVPVIVLLLSALRHLIVCLRDRRFCQVSDACRG